MQDLMEGKKYGTVWCRACGSRRKVNFLKCLKSGWPKCCGVTMTIDNPWEKALLNLQQKKD